MKTLNKILQDIFNNKKSGNLTELEVQQVKDFIYWIDCELKLLDLLNLKWYNLN
jgi:hypothetical protein